MIEVTIRPIDSRDLELLLAWAWIPEIWEYLPTSRRGEELTWEKHIEWFNYHRVMRYDWMIIVDTGKWKPRAVGVAHITRIDSTCPEVGLYIADKNLWGKGVGRKAIQLVLDKIHSIYYFKRLQAVIHPKNKWSIKLFTDLGFKKIGRARKGQELYEYTINRSKGAVS